MGGGDRPDFTSLFKNVLGSLVQTQCQVRKGETTTVELDATELRTGGSTLVVEVRIGEAPLAEGFLEVGSGGEGGRLTTIEGGKAEIHGLRPGTVTLQVRAGMSFAPLGPPQTTTIAGTGDEVRFTLRLPAGELAGKVVDADRGAPIRGACVRAHRADDVATVEVGFVLTSADGSFRFVGLAPGTYSVVADEALSRGTERSGGRVDGLALGAGEVRRDLVLHARTGAQVAVHVRDAAGVPVRHAMVMLVDGEGQPATSLPIAFTDGEGRADLAGLPTGPVRAVARAPSWAPGVSDLRQAAAGGELRLDVALARGTHVHLRLEDRKGQPLAGARVAVRIGEGPWLSSRFLGGMAGSAEVDVGTLAPGPVRVRVVEAQGRTFEVDRTIPSGIRATLTITAPSP
jgi:protocatechuate 3,4-dioxygenase beta subunit